MDSQFDPSVSSTNPALVAGMKSLAWSFDGATQYVNLGNNRDKCWGDLDNCPNGITVAFWLNIPADAPAGEKYFLSSGGQTYQSRGIASLRQTSGLLETRFKTSSQKWFLTTNMISLGVWTHITYIWDLHTGLAVFYNGCFEAELTNGVTHSDACIYNDFYIGRPNNNPNSVFMGQFLMDELQIWEIAKSKEFASRIFTNI